MRTWNVTNIKSSLFYIKSIMVLFRLKNIRLPATFFILFLAYFSDAQEHISNDSIARCDTIKIVNEAFILGRVLEISVTDLAYTPCESDTLIIKYVSKKKVSNLRELKGIYDSNGSIKEEVNRNELINTLGLHVSMNKFPTSYEAPLLYGFEYQRTLKRTNNLERKCILDFNVGILSRSDGDIKDITIIGSSVGYGWDYRIKRLSLMTSLHLSYMHYYRSLREFSEPDIYGPNIVTKSNLIGLTPEFSLGIDVTNQLTIQASANLCIFNNVGAFVNRIWIMSAKLPSIGFRFKF